MIAHSKFDIFGIVCPCQNLSCWIIIALCHSVLRCLHSQAPLLSNPSFPFLNFHHFVSNGNFAFLESLRQNGNMKEIPHMFRATDLQIHSIVHNSLAAFVAEDVTTITAPPRVIPHFEGFIAIVSVTFPNFVVFIVTVI